MMASSGHVALPSGGGGRGSDFSDQEGGKILYTFLVVSDSLVMMTNCACCVHMKTEPGSRYFMYRHKFHSYNESNTFRPTSTKLGQTM